MLQLGTTTFYEEFDPKKSGCEHLSMYGRPYEKSLCHAWSASPIYLLGAYRLRVRNTGVAYRNVYRMGEYTRIDESKGLLAKLEKYKIDG